jgi:DUF4097 and DUF4098 domain-containing protein YvlB
MNKLHAMLKAISCCLCMLVLISGCDFQIGDWGQAKYERTVQQQTSLNPGSNLLLQTSSGSIIVTGGDVTECSVIATIVGRAPSEEEAQLLAEQVKIELETVGDTLTVKAEKPPRKNRCSVSISYDITVPKQTNIECASSYGSIEISNIKGKISGKTSSGSIEAKNIEGPAANLDTSYGSVKCRNITADNITVKSSSGNVKITNASFGECEAHTSYGSIVSDELKGRSIKLNSGSGSISLTASSADTTNLYTSYGRITCRQITTNDITAKSGSGNIDIAFSESTPDQIVADLDTSYGSIDFTAPQNFAGQVDLSTSYGSIRTNRPITISGQISKKELKGTIGEGSGKLHLHTGSGSINLQ